MVSTSSSLPIFLTELGLTTTEQSLYLCGLKSPEASVKELVRESGINRTTAYHALDTLKQKGFTRESKRQGTLYYRMTPPSELSQLLTARQASLEAQKHKLIEMEYLFPVPSVSVSSGSDIDKFEGIENIKLAIEKALYCKSGKWNIIAPKDNFFSQIDKKYTDYFMATRKKRGIQARTLWESPNSSKNTLSLQDTLLRRPRYLPPAFTGKFTSVVIMFDEQMLFIPPRNEQSAILVTSQEIYSTLAVMFDALWHFAEK